MTIRTTLAKNAAMRYIVINDTPRASACMRTQRGSFFAQEVR